MFFLYQAFQYTFINEFRQDETCLDVHESMLGAQVNLYSCHEMKGNQEFEYTKVSWKTYMCITFHTAHGSSKYSAGVATVPP